MISEGIKRRERREKNAELKRESVGSTNLILSKHGELLYTTIIGRG